MSQKIIAQKPTTIEAHRQNKVRRSMTMQQTVHQRKTHTLKKKMGCHKMARQENQALCRKIIAQRKSSAKQARRQGEWARPTMQNKPQKSIKDQGRKNKLTMKV
jgi:hypothetical protein